MDNNDRRDFLKKAGMVSVVGVAGGFAASPEALGEEQKKALAKLRTLKVNLEAKAVLSDGSLKTRAEILQQLGLNPSTQADSWLTIVYCGTNASALTDLEKSQLSRRGLKFEGNELVGGAVK